MDISSVSSGSFNRAVTPTRKESDRHSNGETQATNEQNKAREDAAIRAQERALERRAVQERLEQRNLESNLENQRRLDGRIIAFGQDNENVSNEQQQENRAAYNRDRVREAYTPPKNELTNSHSEQAERAEQRQEEAIDLVV